ncbi:MAG: ATP-binding protein [bacterium]
MFEKSEKDCSVILTNPKKKYHYYGVLILFLIMPVLSVLIYKLVPQTVGFIKNIQLHTLIEAFGSVVALFVAVIFIKREKIERSEYFLIIALGFLCMGILKAFHSASPIGNGFVLLHIMASLMGSLIFVLAWWPAFRNGLHYNMYLYIIPIAISFFLGVFVYAFPDKVPVLINNSLYTDLANNLHFLAGVLFLFSALRFIIVFQDTETFESFLLLCLMLLFALTELTFGYSALWGIQWWAWHILGLVAYLVMLRFLFTDYEGLMDRLNLYLFQAKKSEERLKKEHERLISIFDSMNEPIYIADPDTYEILYLNEAAKRFWGNSIGQKCFAVFHNFDSPCFFCSNEEIFGKNQGRSYVWEFYHDSLNKWFRNIDRSIPWTDGKMVRFQMAVSIDDVKKAEQAIKETTDMKSKFISMASHELRTPLATIKESVDLILDGIVGGLTEKQSHILGITKNNIKRLVRLVNDILDFQRLQSGKMPFYFHEHNINEIISQVYESMKSAADQKQLYFSLDLQPDLPKVLCDKDKITQVIINVVHNAIKFVDAGGVAITTQSNPKGIEIIIKDSGPGIKKEDKQKLFKTFEQLRPNENTETKGTGLGLAISKEIIIEHKGKIWVESTLGQGSVFNVSLPFTRS